MTPQLFPMKVDGSEPDIAKALEIAAELKAIDPTNAAAWVPKCNALEVSLGGFFMRDPVRAAALRTEQRGAESVIVELDISVIDPHRHALVSELPFESAKASTPRLNIFGRENISLVRKLRTDASVPWRGTVEGPVRTLGVVAAWSGPDAVPNASSLRNAWNGLTGLDAGSDVIQVQAATTQAQLTAQIRKSTPHVLHIISHGDTSGMKLNGLIDPLPPETLVEWVNQVESLRMLVLWGCQTRSSYLRALDGLPLLAVVASPASPVARVGEAVESIKSDEFWRKFYDPLLKSTSVAVAASVARRACVRRVNPSTTSVPPAHGLVLSMRDPLDRLRTADGMLTATEIARWASPVEAALQRFRGVASWVEGDLPKLGQLLKSTQVVEVVSGLLELDDYAGRLGLLAAAILSEVPQDKRGQVKCVVPLVNARLRRSVPRLALGAPPAVGDADNRVADTSWLHRLSLFVRAYRPMLGARDGHQFWDGWLALEHAGHVAALGHLGYDDDAAAGAVVLAIRSADVELSRGVGVMALARMAAFNSIRDLLESPPDRSCRADILYWLAESAQPKVAPLAATYFMDEDEEVRVQALRAVGRLDPVGHVDELASRLDSETSRRPQRAALDALARASSDRAKKAMGEGSKKVYPEVVTALASARDVPQVLMHSLLGAYEWPDDGSLRPVTPSTSAILIGLEVHLYGAHVFEGLLSPEGSTRYGMARLVDWCSAWRASAVETARRGLDSKDSGIQGDAIRLLGHLGDLTSAERIAALLPSAFAPSLIALGDLGADQYARKALDLLSPQIDTYPDGPRLLARLGDHVVESPLYKWLGHHPDVRVRASAARGLTLLKAEDAEQRLAGRLGRLDVEEDSYEVTVLVTCLGSFREGTSARARVLGLLDAPVPAVRAAALAALASWKVTPDAGALKRRLRDSHGIVRDAALRLLDRIPPVRTTT